MSIASKRIERHVCSVKGVSRNIIFGLSYALEDNLLKELYQPAITVINNTNHALECGLNRAIFLMSHRAVFNDLQTGSAWLFSLRFPGSVYSRPTNEYCFSNCKPVSNPLCGCSFLDRDADSQACDSHDYFSLCMSLMYSAHFSPRHSVCHDLSSHQVLRPHSSRVFSPALLTKSSSFRGMTLPFMWMLYVAFMSMTWWSLWLDCD